MRKLLVILWLLAYAPPAGHYLPPIPAPIRPSPSPSPSPSPAPSPSPSTPTVILPPSSPTLPPSPSPSPAPSPSPSPSPSSSTPTLIVPPSSPTLPPSPSAPPSSSHWRSIAIALAVLGGALGSAAAICWLSRRQISTRAHRDLELASRSRLHVALQSLVDGRVSLADTVTTITAVWHFALLPDVFHSILSENRGDQSRQNEVRDRLLGLLIELQRADDSVLESADRYVPAFRASFCSVSCQRFGDVGGKLIGAFYGTMYKMGLLQLSDLSTMRFSRIQADGTMLAFGRAVFEAIEDFRENSPTVFQAMSAFFDDNPSAWIGLFMRMSIIQKAPRKMFFIMLCVKGECSIGECLSSMDDT